MQIQALPIPLSDPSTRSPCPVNLHNLPIRRDSGGTENATPVSPYGGPQQGATHSDAAHFDGLNVEGPHQSSPDDPSPSSAPPVGRSGDNPNCEYQADQDNLLANPGSIAQSVCTPPSSDTAGLWTPAPTKRCQASTKRPPASQPRDLSQDPKKSKDSAFSSPMDVEDLVTRPLIKMEDKADSPPPMQHIRPMEYFHCMELVSDVPPHLHHFLRKPYQSKGNHWEMGDSSLMNSDLTVALHHLFLLMTGFHPSEDQRVGLQREGLPEALLYGAVIHLREGQVIKSRVAELMPLDEYCYLKIVLTSAHRLFPVEDGCKTPGTMEFLFW